MKHYIAHCDLVLDGSPLCMAMLDMLSLSTDFAYKWQLRDWTMPLVLETDANGILQRVSFGTHESAETATLADLEARTEPFSGMDRGCTIAVTYYDKGLGKIKVPALAGRTPKGFFIDPNGLHQLGGSVPQGFKPAQTGFDNATQYIGTLSSIDPEFSTLAHDLHLCVPIFDEFKEIVLDYEDPLAPKVANGDFLPDLFIQSPHGKVDGAISAAWEPIKLSIRSVGSNSLETDDAKNRATRIGLTGTPHFVQSPTMPISPKSGKPIPFLCQLTGYPWPQLQPHALALIDTTERFHAPTKLNFWGDGQVFLFWEAETKILGVSFQNT